MKVTGLTLITPNGARHELVAVDTLLVDRGQMFAGVTDVKDTGILDPGTGYAQVVASFPSSWGVLYRWDTDPNRLQEVGGSPTLAT